MVLQGHEGAVLCVAQLPHSEFIVSGSSDATIRIWNLHTGTCEGAKPLTLPPPEQLHNATELRVRGIARAHRVHQGSDALA